MQYVSIYMKCQMANPETESTLAVAGDVERADEGVSANEYRLVVCLFVFGWG